MLSSYLKHDWIVIFTPSMLFRKETGFKVSYGVGLKCLPKTSCVDRCDFGMRWGPGDAILALD